MMPENKPMKMQWLNIDGRQVPSILPNHWNEQKNDWDITGTKNPLPIANYTQNASGVWLPTSKDNPVPTQLTGSNIEEVHEELSVPSGSIIQVSIENVSALIGNIFVKSDQVHDLLVYADLMCGFGVSSDTIKNSIAANWDGGSVRYNVNEYLPASRFSIRVRNRSEVESKIKIGVSFQR